jgi:hypothetical protein
MLFLCNKYVPKYMKLAKQIRGCGFHTLFTSGGVHEKLRTGGKRGIAELKRRSIGGCANLHVFCSSVDNRCKRKFRRKAESEGRDDVEKRVMR